MQAHRECLAIRIILLNFTFRNHFRTIMKKCADNRAIYAQKISRSIVGKLPKTRRQKATSPPIMTSGLTLYLAEQSFLSNMPMCIVRSAVMTSIPFAGNLIARKVLLLPLIISIPSSKAVFRHASIPYRNILRLCQRLMLQKCCIRQKQVKASFQILHRALPSATLKSGCRTLPNGLLQWLPTLWTTVNAVTIPALY